MLTIDFSWWPVLTVPFPYTENGITVNFTWLDSVLTTAGAVVGPLLLLVASFFAIRRLFVNWKGGE